MTKNYQHSEVFARLKGIKEDMPTSLTTYQWLSTLDYFIESALDPIATAMPVMANNYFAKVIAWQVHKPSIKFSRINKFDLPTLLFNSITTEGAQKRKFQKDMLLNRGLLFGLITTFSHTVNNYMRLHDPCYLMPSAKRKTLIAMADARIGNPYLYASASQSTYWATKAFEFKELIVQKYTRMAIMDAKGAYVSIGYQLKLDDVIQTYLMFLSKAIDRCDSRQGVLTTFIKTWFYSAKAAIIKEASLGHVTSSYEELLESGLPAVDPDTSYEDLQHLCHEAKRVDPVGTLRFVLGIPEFFSKSQIEFLTHHNH